MGLDDLGLGGGRACGAGLAGGLHVVFQSVLGGTGWMGSGGEWWSVPGAVGQLRPGGFPRPVDRQVQHHPTSGAGEPGGDVDELSSDGAGGGFGVKRRGEHAAGAGEVERHRRANQPGTIGPKPP